MGREGKDPDLFTVGERQFEGVGGFATASAGILPYRRRMSASIRQSQKECAASFVLQWSLKPPIYLTVDKNYGGSSRTLRFGIVAGVAGEVGVRRESANSPPALRRRM